MQLLIKSIRGLKKKNAPNSRRGIRFSRSRFGGFAKESQKVKPLELENRRLRRGDSLQRAHGRVFRARRARGIDEHEKRCPHDGSTLERFGEEVNERYGYRRP